MGPEELLCGGCPESRGPRRFALKGGLGAQQTGAPVPSLPPLPFQNLMQCFRVWGARAREGSSGSCYRRVLPRTDPAHKGFLRSPVP